MEQEGSDPLDRAVVEQVGAVEGTFVDVHGGDHHRRLARPFDPPLGIVDCATTIADGQ